MKYKSEHERKTQSVNKAKYILDQFGDPLQDAIEQCHTREQIDRRDPEQEFIAAAMELSNLQARVDGERRETGGLHHLPVDRDCPVPGVVYILEWPQLKDGLEDDIDRPYTEETLTILDHLFRLAHPAGDSTRPAPGFPYVEDLPDWWSPKPYTDRWMAKELL